MRRFLVMVVLALSVGACALLHVESRAPVGQVSLVYERGDFRVYRYASPRGGSVNSWWIETNEGAVILDAQRVESQSSQLVQDLHEAGASPVALVITHAHPDHFGGAGLFQREFPGIRVLASAETDEHLQGDHYGYVGMTRELLGDDFLPSPLIVDELLEDGRTLQIAGVTFVFHEFGVGEAEYLTVIEVPEHDLLFTTDVINHRMHPFLLLGRTSEWLAQLDRLEARFPDARLALPGHGAPGDSKELIRGQREYLRFVREQVEARIGDGELSGDERREVEDQIHRRYPGYDVVAEVPDLVSLNIDAVAAELLGKGGS